MERLLKKNTNVTIKEKRRTKIGQRPIRFI